MSTELGEWSGVWSKEWERDANLAADPTAATVGCQPQSHTAPPGPLGPEMSRAVVSIDGVTLALSGTVTGTIWCVVSDSPGTKKSPMEIHP